MKNKKLTYILLPLVVLVWALVIYRIFFEGKAKPENISTLAKPLIKESVKEEKNTYKLIANYRDPFLSRIKQSAVNKKVNKEKETQNTSSNLRRRRTSVSRIRWPEIAYGGFIEDDTDQEITILLNLNKRDYLVKEGDIIDQIIVKAFYGDSLLVEYKDEEKILKK